MKTFPSIISLWPTISSLAEDLGVQYVTAQAMVRRQRIPPRYWNALVAGAQRRGFSGVTLSALADISELETSKVVSEQHDQCDQSGNDKKTALDPSRQARVTG